MGNDGITAFRTREQLRRFLGIFSPRFSKPKLEFLGQMPVGIQAARDTLVVAVAYFSAAWLGRKARLEALANHVAKVSRKMFEASEFFCYAIADGLRRLFVRHGWWRGLDCAREERGDLQMEFELLTG